MMANGSSYEGPARADRYREKYERMFRRTQSKLDAVRELAPYREEMDPVSEVTLGREGLKAKGPPWVLIVISLLAFAAFVAWLLTRR